MHVLVVEDDREIAETLGDWIHALAHEATIVHDVGELAMALRRHVHYALALVDVGLPHMDGYELGTYIASLDIPVVIVTATKSAALEEQTRALGFAAHVVKPIDELRLREILAHHGKPEKA